MERKLEYAHLLGRAFEFGTSDCFALGREFFSHNFGIEIPNFARPSDWSADELDLIRELHEQTGFEMITKWRVKDLRPADVLCLAIGERNPNHFAILTDDGQMLHHLRDRLSQAVPFEDFWRRCTCFVLRHPDVPDLRPPVVESDLARKLNERNAGFQAPA